MKVDLYLTPFPFKTASSKGKAVVAIDVLRSSTSTCAALINGAKGVIPSPGSVEAGEMRKKIGSDISLLAGERDNIKLENFDLGNSPAEFIEEIVKDKLIIMTTSNGTAIFGMANNAELVICGALVNISKVAERIASTNYELAIVCAGQKGGFSIEDTICAGMLIHTLNVKHHIETELNDAGALALLLYRTNKTALAQVIQQGEHGRRLTSDGFADDVANAAVVDSIPVLPVLTDGLLVVEDIKIENN